MNNKNSYINELYKQNDEENWFLLNKKIEGDSSNKNNNTFLYKNLLFFNLSLVLSCLLLFSQLIIFEIYFPYTNLSSFVYNNTLLNKNTLIDMINSFKYHPIENIKLDAYPYCNSFYKYNQYILGEWNDLSNICICKEKNKINSINDNNISDNDQIIYNDNDSNIIYIDKQACNLKRMTIMNKNINNRICFSSQKDIKKNIDSIYNKYFCIKRANYTIKDLLNIIQEDYNVNYENIINNRSDLISKINLIESKDYVNMYYFPICNGNISNIIFNSNDEYIILKNIFINHSDSSILKADDDNDKEGIYYKNISSTFLNLRNIKYNEYIDNNTHFQENVKIKYEVNEVENGAFIVFESILIKKEICNFRFHNEIISRILFNIPYRISLVNSHDISISNDSLYEIYNLHKNSQSFTKDHKKFLFNSNINLNLYAFLSQVYFSNQYQFNNNNSYSLLEDDYGIFINQSVLHSIHVENFLNKTSNMTDFVRISNSLINQYSTYFNLYITFMLLELNCFIWNGNSIEVFINNMTHILDIEKHQYIIKYILIVTIIINIVFLFIINLNKFLDSKLLSRLLKYTFQFKSFIFSNDSSLQLNYNKIFLYYISIDLIIKAILFFFVIYFYILFNIITSFFCSYILCFKNISFSSIFLFFLGNINILSLSLLILIVGNLIFSLIFLNLINFNKEE